MIVLEAAKGLFIQLLTHMSGLTRFSLSPSTIQRSHGQGRGGEAEREKGERETGSERQRERARERGERGGSLKYHLSFYVFRYTATCATVSFASKVVLSGDWPVRKT